MRTSMKQILIASCILLSLGSPLRAQTTVSSPADLRSELRLTQQRLNQQLVDQLFALWRWQYAFANMWALYDQGDEATIAEKYKQYLATRYKIAPLLSQLITSENLGDVIIGLVERLSSEPTLKAKVSHVGLFLMASAVYQEVEWAAHLQAMQEALAVVNAMPEMQRVFIPGYIFWFTESRDHTMAALLKLGHIWQANPRQMRLRQLTPHVDSVQTAYLTGVEYFNLGITWKNKDFAHLDLDFSQDLQKILSAWRERQVKLRHVMQMTQITVAGKRDNGIAQLHQPFSSWLSTTPIRQRPWEIFGQITSSDIAQEQVYTNLVSVCGSANAADLLIMHPQVVAPQLHYSVVRLLGR